MKDLTLSEKLFQSLLDHFWRARDANVPWDIDQFPKGYAISYKKLIEASGVPLDPRNAGGPLFDVANFCKSEGWPPLHSLVVRGKEGLPGEGYFSTPGSEMKDFTPEQRYQKWAGYVRNCATSDKYPRKAPKLI